MNPIIKNILAVVAGLILGSIINMGLIMISGFVIPPPNGADISTEEGLKAALPLFEPKHFIFPFLAHALGTLVGAFVAVMIANPPKMRAAWIVGGIFLLGGISNILMLPSPTWFTILDLAGAYIPMAYLAGKFAQNKSNNS